MTDFQVSPLRACAVVCCLVAFSVGAVAVTLADDKMSALIGTLIFHVFLLFAMCAEEQ